MAIDLYKVKERKAAVLNLKKERGIDGVSAEVVLVMDYSGSMSALYRNGTVQRTLEKILPFGLGFDDNGLVDVYLFHDKVISLPNKMTLKNLDGYVDREIYGKYAMGGTAYAPAINAITDNYRHTTGGFLGLGAKAAARELPVYVIFITDGENGDKAQAETALREASRYGFFFQFVGIGSESFRFLQKLDDLSGREIDNADFFKVPNLDTVTDDQLYSLLMTEFPKWLPLAKGAGLLR